MSPRKPTGPARDTSNDPFTIPALPNTNRIALRTEEEQQAAAREREAEEKKAAQIAHRDARRKSLAARRVSFAPEATLHTWDVVEYMQDSTTSSNSTNATNRRASEVSNDTIGSSESRPHFSSDPAEPPSTPPDHIEAVAETPDDQRQLHQKKKRRSSGIPPLDFNNPDDEFFSSSPSAFSSSPGGAIDDDFDDGDDDDEDDSDDDGTAMTIDVGDQTDTMASMRSYQSDNSTGGLEERLRLAAQQAGTHGIDFDENGPGVGEDGDDDDDEEDLISFKPLWSKKVIPPESANDQENVDPYASAARGPETEGEETMTMEMTRAVGSILPALQQAAAEESEDEITMDMTMDMTRARGRILGGATQPQDDQTETMDMTMAMGRIIPAPQQQNHASSPASEDDQTMEITKDMTRAVVRIMPNQQPVQPTVNQGDDMTMDITMDMTMDMTRAVGGILQGAAQLQEDQTETMEMTMAVAKILPPQQQKRTPSPPSEDDQTMDITMDMTKAVGKIMPVNYPSLPEADAEDDAPMDMTMDMTMAMGGILPPASRQVAKQLLETEVNHAQLGDALMKDSPTKLFPPPATRSVSATPVKKAVTPAKRAKTPTPVKTSSSPAKKEKSPAKKAARIRTPTPEVEEKPEHYRPLRGRKSLHVGAALGLLGKRPAELDEDSEDEGGTKRLKNFQGSPVKNVKLGKPPTKEEVTGRTTRAQRKSLDASASATTTPVKSMTPIKDAMRATTPKDQGRFVDVEEMFPEARTPVPFKKDATITIPLAAEQVKPVIEMPPMKLQEFLDLTSIRFMELTTTKRRHTVAPNLLKDASHQGQDDGSLESCVVAGACTLPMLELFQHSCHELKRYISEGRKVVKEIEAETAEENPPLFQEYATATPDMKSFMDIQFKNIKTNARLQSKGIWYEWRHALLEGLKAGLVKIQKGFTSDDKRLSMQEELIHRVLPDLQGKFETLREEEEQLREAAEEILKSNPEDLKEARKCLIALDADIEAKKAMIADLRAQIAEKDAGIQIAAERKETYLEDIKAAEKIREECRGWTGTEIQALKKRVKALEHEHGWTITGVHGTTVMMSFRRDLELLFDTSSFKSSTESNDAPKQNSLINLRYIAADRESDPEPFSPEKEFFVGSIFSHIRAFAQSETTVKQLLDTVSSGWEAALNIIAEIKSLNRQYPSQVEKTGDSSLKVSSTMLLKGLRSKVLCEYHISTAPGVESEGGTMKINVNANAKAVYGERFNEDSMMRFLNKGIEEGRSWVEVVKDLDARLVARGKK